MQVNISFHVSEIWLKLITEGSVISVTEALQTFIFSSLITWNRWLPITKLRVLSDSPFVLPNSFLKNIFTLVKEPFSYYFHRKDACLELRFPSPLSESILSSDYFPRGISVFMACIRTKAMRRQMAALLSFYTLWFLGFSTVHRKVVTDCSVEAALLIIGGFAWMTWGKVHSSVLLLNALGPALELSSSLSECHITHAPSLPPLHCCLATAVLVLLARQERDKWITKKTPSLVISHTICRKVQSECSASMLSQNCSLEVFFVTRKEPLASTTLKIRGLFSS